MEGRNMRQSTQYPKPFILLFCQQWEEISEILAKEVLLAGSVETNASF